MANDISEEMREQIELEDRACEIRKAVLSDADFMGGVREAMEAEERGEQGRPWPEVKKELGIV